jgi:hypothetical protein
MRLPGRLTGNDPLVRWLNSLREFAASCRITSFQGGYMSQGANGTQLISVITAGSGAPGGVGMLFRGEYSSEVAYSVQDVVVIRTGANAGTYVCVQANPGSTNPPTTPDTGNAYWVQLVGGASVGKWV